MLPKPARWIGRYLWVIPFLALSCATVPTPQRADVRPVSEREPLAVGLETPSPVEFRKFILKFPRDRVIGSVQKGRSCVGLAPLTWQSGRDSTIGESFGEVLLRELASAGYAIPADRDRLFETSGGRRAEYVIAGVIRDIRSNICYPSMRRKVGTAEASLAVDWEIYSHRTRTVELKLTTEGSSFLSRAEEEPAPEAIARAFVSAARNLLAERRFHDLLTGRGSAPASREPIPVAYETLPARGLESVESVVSDSRMGVVTVFAGEAMGSGFVISQDGYLLTGQHVVGDARYVRVKFVTGREVNGEVVRSDNRRDVALIKLESDIYQYLPLGESTRVRPGAEVFAIGTPLAENFGQTVTKGVVSGYGEEDGLRTLRSDVSVHRGNSGGPLLDRTGVVVGISVSGFMLLPDGVGVGLNSFIPIEEALDSLAIRRR
jgi:serine protease Do